MASPPFVVVLRSWHPLPPSRPRTLHRLLPSPRIGAVLPKRPVSDSRQGQAGKTLRMRQDAEARRAALVSAVVAEGGVVRRVRMRGAGHSARDIADAVAAGALRSLRRVWLAAPGADPLLVAAARDGVVLTCVTEAKRRELWVLDAGTAHVAARPHAGRVTAAGAVVHWHTPLVPRDPDQVHDGLVNTLVQVAICQASDAALAVWESALNKRLIAYETLAALPLPGSARRLLEIATPFSDSGLETLVPPRLRWLGVRIVPQACISGHRVDFLIGERLVLQIDGATHTGAQRTADIRHDAELMLMGYHVIRVGYAQVVHDWPAVQQLVMHAVAQGLHLVGARSPR